MKKRLSPIEAYDRVVERTEKKLEAARAKCKHKNFEKRHADIGDGYSVYEGGMIGSHYVTDCTCRDCGHRWRVEGSLNRSNVVGYPSNPVITDQILSLT